MRRFFHQVTACCLIVALAAAVAAYVSAAPASILGENTLQALEEKQRLVAEILELDTKLALLHADKDRAETRLEKLRADLNYTQQEKSQLVAKAAAKEQIVGQWLRFLAEEGSLTYLDVLFGAANLSDFLSRLELIIAIIESNVSSLQQLQALTQQIENKEKEFRAQEQEIAATYATINQSLKRAEELRQAKAQALAEAERKLADFPAVLALSQAWEQVLPDIDQCLDRVSKLPWNTIQPDKVQLNYLRGQAEVTFKETTLENLLNRGLSPKDHFRFRCEPPFMVLERPGLDYRLSFTLRPDKRRLIFEPHSVTVGDTQIPDSALELLFKDRDLSLNIPLLAGLEIAQAEVISGEIRIFLKKGA
ncbi:MAG: hypothetical protein GX489_02390 [Firmicutes bacterium]|nr:hypothetical protein [Bacillota bacterium]